MRAGPQGGGLVSEHDTEFCYCVVDVANFGARRNAVRRGTSDRGIGCTPSISARRLPAHASVAITEYDVNA
ncbi:MAG: hypothetical protein QOF31_516 [Mycobacterium sp.]|jgi:hypothetical protein|nr:hypothetical protein [Mycobacterium sp.]